MIHLVNMSKKIKVFNSFKRITIEEPYVSFEVGYRKLITFDINEIKKIYIKKNKPNKLFYLGFVSQLIWMLLFFFKLFSFVNSDWVAVLLIMVNLLYVFNFKTYSINVLLVSGELNQFFFSNEIKHNVIEKLQLVRIMLNDELLLETKSRFQNNKINEFSFI